MPDDRPRFEKSEETHRAQGKENLPGRKAVHDTEKQRLRSDDDAAENQEHRRAPKDRNDGGRGNWESSRKETTKADDGSATKWWWVVAVVGEKEEVSEGKGIGMVLYFFVLYSTHQQ